MRQYQPANSNQQKTQQVSSKSSTRQLKRPAVPPFGAPVVQRNHDKKEIKVGKNKWSDEEVKSTWAISESLNLTFGALNIPVHAVHQMGVENGPGKQELHMALTWVGKDNNIYVTPALKNYRPEDEHTEIQAATDIFNTAKSYYESKEADPNQKMKGLIIEIKQTLSPCNSCLTYLQMLLDSISIKTIVRASSMKKHNSKLGAAINAYDQYNAQNQGAPDMKDINGLHLKKPNMEWG